jgi:hypothetical protein
VDRYEPGESAPRGVCPVIRRSAPRRLVVAATGARPCLCAEREARALVGETTDWHDGARPERDLLFLPCALRVVKESSGSGVKLEQAAEPVSTANGFALREWVWRGEEEKIALTLVVPFKMMMIDVFVQRPA